jgi:hypothetical protein
MNEQNSEILDLMNCMNEQVRDYRFMQASCFNQNMISIFKMRNPTNMR